MKSRMKKLLAAALALCLIAALVPGAALAADGEAVATIIENGKETEFDTLEEALEKAESNTKNKEITLNTDYTLTQNAELSSGVKLIVPTGVTLTVSGSTFSVNGTLDLEGNLVVGRGFYESVGKLNASVAIDTGTQSSIEVNGEVSFSAAQEINGVLTIKESGKVTASNIMTVNGSAEILGELQNSNELRIIGDADVSGTVTGSINVAPSGTITYKGDTTINSTLTVDGNMLVEAEVTVGSSANVTINGSLDVNDKLIEQKAITLGTRAVLTVSNGATAELAAGHNFASGTTSVENNGTLKVGDIEYVGDNSISGEVNVTTEDYDTVLVIPTGKSASVNLNKAYTIDKKLVVRGTLTIDSYTYISNELNVDGGMVTVDSTLDFAQSSGLLTGDGQIDVSGTIYNKNNNNDFGSVSVRMLSGGHVYSTTESIASNITSGQAVTEAAGDGKTYPYTVAYSGSGSFTITKGTVTGGTGTINIATSANANSTVDFSVSTTSGYVIDKAWYVRYGETTPNYVYVSGISGSFPMPAEDVTFNVSLKKAETPAEPEGDTYTITPTTSANGKFVVNATKADAGEVVTITTSPNSGYKVSRVSVTGAVASKFTDNVYTFTMPNQNVTVSVTFERGDYQVTLTNNNYDDGRISLSSGTTTTGRYAEGERVYIYAYPDRDFYVRSLTITRTDNRQTVNYYESSSSDDVFYFDMPASDVTVRAYFTDGVYEIATDIDGSGRLTITGEDGNVTDVAEEGEEIRITASANNGYRLGDLYVTYTDSDDEDQTIYPEVEYKNNGNVDYYWFEMPEYDVEIYADFGEGDYVAWIDRSDMENGTIRVSPNVADEDDTVSIYVTPDTGYQLDELIVEDEDGHDVTTTSLASGTRYTFRMPDSDVTVTATFKSRSYSSNFTDVPRYEWYYEAVSYVASEGLMNGVSTTQFNPNGTASRAQIVTILWRLAGEPSALTGAFTDVPAGQYYSTAVAWASRQGIVTGVGNNRFEPNSNITREQLAVILYRYAQDAGYTTSASANITGYYDYARVNSYARTAMSWAVGAGLITGTSTTTLSPQDTATRAQVATILMRFCENIAK